MLRLFGVKIQGSFTSEAQVFARILGHRQQAYAAHVLYHVSSGTENGASEFRRVSEASVAVFDARLRPRLRGRKVPVEKVLSLLRFRTALPWLLREARSYSPHVVYSSQQLWDCAAASYVADRLAVPHIMHLHYVVGPWLRSGFSRNSRALPRMIKALGLTDPVDRLRSCAHVVAVSDFVRSDAISHGIDAARITTIHNTVTPPEPAPRDERLAVRRELRIPEDATVIGIVGRFDPDKGHADTLAAFSRIAATNPRLRLVMIGDGPLRPAIGAEVARLGLANRVTTTGHRLDARRLLHGMDVFAHPSRREPFGLAMAEASAAGLPVVAYAEGGALEIVDNGRSGLLSAPGDVEALAANLARLAGHPDEARRMGCAGRERVHTFFSPTRSAREFAALLCRVAEQADDRRLRAG